MKRTRLRKWLPTEGWIRSYPAMLSHLSTVEGDGGVSVRSIGFALGVSHTVSDAFAYAITAGLLGLAIAVLRRRQGEARAFGLTVMAGLTASPVVWPHYLILAFVPIALLTPSLSVLWLVPLLAYLAPVAQTSGNFALIGPYLVIELIVIGALAGGWPSGRARLQTRAVAPQP